MRPDLTPENIADYLRRARATMGRRERAAKRAIEYMDMTGNVVGPLWQGRRMLSSMIGREAGALISAAFAGDAAAGANLVYLADNAVRGVVARVLLAADVPRPVFREALNAAWDHDPGATGSAFDDLPDAFAEAQFAVDHLPETVLCWRGDRGDREPSGISWTLDRDIACWFAMAHQTTTPRVRRLQIPRGFVLAHITSRNEEEIIVDPWDSCSLAEVDGDIANWAAAADRHIAARK